jgi:hypothetical protein
MALRAVSVAACLLATAVAAQEKQEASGPFGLRMGMTLAELKTIGPVKPEKGENWYTITVPKPHSSFESYSALVHPRLGLVKLFCSGVTIETSGAGYELRAEFDKLEAQLDRKYGRGKRFDRLDYGAIWKEPNEWMMAVLKKERSLKKFYLAKEGSENLGSITVIVLDADALSRSAGWVSVGYEFADYSKVKQEREQHQTDAL